MNTNLTDITMVLDRSGSMSTIRNDVIGGVNEFLRTQRECDGQCVFSLVQFDTENPHEWVFTAEPIRLVADLTEKTFQPRAGTPLLDAVGSTIVKIGERLSKIREEDRPGNVILVVVTDGEENSSKEFTRARVNEMSMHQQERYGWKVIFIGANLDEVATAEGADSCSVSVASSCSSSSSKSGEAIRVTGQNVNAYRRSGIARDLHYTDDQREELSEELDAVRGAKDAAKMIEDGALRVGQVGQT